MEPHFLPATPGQRFCLYYPPLRAEKPQRGVVYVPPFAEEMNKVRRMAALQARRLAALGVAVAAVDLLGTGDSSGEFGDATWEAWKEDVAHAVRFLEARGCATISLWGLRLGALLALDSARGAGRAFERFILWQPVVNGETFLTQFLRLKVANQMLAGGVGQGGTGALKETLAAGRCLEIAGYDLAPVLAAAIERLSLSALAPERGAVHWFEVAAQPASPLSPAGQRVVDAWRSRGATVDARTVAGEPFWATVEIAVCPELLEATTAIFSR